MVISVLLAALGYLAFAVYSGWREVWAAVAQVGVIGLGFALCLSLTNYTLRFMRWQVYLRVLGHQISWPTSLRIYLAGFALTTTPGKAGEAIRGVLLKRLSVPYPDSFAAILSERLSDLVAIVLLTLFGLALYPKTAPLIILGAGLATLLLALVSQSRLITCLHRRIPAPLQRKWWIANSMETLYQASRCHQPTTLAWATILSLVGWAAEAFAFFLILHWMGLDVTLVFAVFVFAVSMLAGALSFTPGGLGSTEGVMAGLLVWHGVGLPEAVAATVLIRATTLWFAVVLGIASILCSKNHLEIQSS